MKAHEDWLVFANDKSARLLYWQANEADCEQLKVYFQGQREMSSAVLQLVAPFESADQYGCALADEIVAYYDARRETSKAAGIAADWLPPMRNKTDPTQYLFNVLSSLLAHHPDIFPGMVLVLSPERIGKRQAFEQWLDQLLVVLSAQFVDLSRRTRFVMYGSDSTAFNWIMARQPERARVIEGRYNMEALPRELVAQSGERGASGQFRRLFVELSECLSRPDPARLERLRAAALEVSESKSWFDQSATVHLLSGAAFLKWGMKPEALKTYREATAAGHRAREASHPAGNKLVINGLFGEASVLLADKGYSEASRCYARAADFARADESVILLIECYRMQAWCLDQIRERESALDAAFQGLRVGESIETAMRANTNLQLVASWLLERIDWLHLRRNELERMLESLYGTDWKATMQPLPGDEVSAQLMASEKNDEDVAS